MKMVGKGAESYIFSVRILGTDAILKIRKPKKYRIKALDSSLRRRRTRREARVMHAALKSGAHVPAIFAIGEFSIYMQRIPGKLLKDSEVPGSFYGGLGRELGALHSASIAHGDFTPANVMVSRGAAYVIDFGLSEMTKSTEEKAIDLLLMKRSLSDANYLAMLGAYKKSYDKSSETIKRLEEIEERGRYKIRTLE